MSENYKSTPDKKETLEDKFKEYSFLIKNCKICGGKGYKFDLTKTRGLVTSNKAEQCECVKQVYRFALYKSSNIPSEYFELDFDKHFVVGSNPQNEENKKYIGKITKNLNAFTERGFGIYLYGYAGTGKSFAAIEVLKKALESGSTGYYEFFPLIIDAFMKKGFSAEPKKEYYTEIFEKKDVLVIDELGKETQDNYNFKKDDIARILEINILKNRSNKTTILVSNIGDGIDGVKEKYSPYVYSVLKQKFKPLEFDGADFRTKIHDVDVFLESKGE